MSKWSRLGWIGALIMVAFLSACVTGVTTWHLLGIRQEPSVNVQTEVPLARRPSGPRPASVGRTTILVLGVDERLDDVGRSDTIMVASLDPGQGDVSLLSIQRDTWTEIPGYGWDKINHAYAFGQHQLTLATVQQLLDIPIDHWVIINFAGFQAMVDAVGGIEVDVTESMHYEDPKDDNGGLYIHFEPGHYKLDGQKALEYARYRSGPDADIGRMRRQQEVIKLVLQKAMNPAIALRVPQLISSLSNAIRTDLNLPEILQLASAGKDLLARGPVQTAIIKGEGSLVGDIFYDVLNLGEVRQTAYRMLLGQEPPADFLERAEKAQAVQTAAIREAEQAAAAARAAAVLASAPAPAHQTADQPQQGDAKPENPPDATAGTTGDEQQKSAATTVTDQTAITGNVTSQNDRSRTRLPATILYDFSGKDLIGSTVKRLRQEKFNVMHFARSSRLVDKTVIIDRSGDDQVTAKLKELFPWARIEPGAAAADVQVEIRLGRDAR